MNGKCNSVIICEGIGTGEELKCYYFNQNWNIMPFTKDYYDNPDIEITKLKMIEKGFEIAESLLKDFPFVRVELLLMKS